LAIIVLDALDEHPEPVAIEEVVDGAVDETFDPLGAPPVAHVALRLDPWELVAKVRPANGRPSLCAAQRQLDGRPSANIAAVWIV
jgi:hypothetical protein